MVVRFATFEIDDELFELRRDGVPVPIQRKTFDLLLYLARSGGAVVTREELISKVWPSVVVSEPALTQAILTVRKALDDDANDPKIVKTVRGRGYRFAETVTGADPPAPRRRFVGRSAAIAHLEKKIAEARAGEGRVVLVTGEQGVGKTELLAEVESRLAREPGVRVLRGSAFAGDGAPPLWPWIQIGRRLGFEDAGALVEGPATPEAAFRIGDHIVRRLLERSKTEPLFVVLEDVQWADAASLDVLLLLAPQLADARIAVVVTTRGGAVLGQPDRRLGTLGRLPISSSLELERLGRTDVAALVESLTGETPSDVVVDRVLEKTGGNPSLILQIAHVLTHDAAVLGTSAMLPTSAIKRAVAAQVAALPSAVRDALSVASVIGVSFDLAPLALATSQTPDDLLALLDVAIAEGVLSRGERRTHRFTQPLVRDALYRGLPDGARVKMHAKVGRALLELAGDQATAMASEIAPHLVAAAPLGDAGLAIEYAMHAVAHASARADRASAERFVQLARSALDAARPLERTAWAPRVDDAARAISARTTLR